jgi:hypothetical protein
MQKTKIVGTAYGTLQNVRFGGVGKTAILLRSAAKPVPGFGSVWEIIKLDEAKKIFSKADLQVIQSTPDLKGFV